MSLGSYTNGTGNITVYTANGNVYGSGTTFLTQLKPGAVIGNTNSNFAGYISTVVSNTFATFTTNSAINISNAVFKYRPISANAFTYTYYTTGNITANTASKIVSGSGTHFPNEIKYGDSLWIANSGAGPNTFVGVVDLIISNTQVYLAANSLANVSNLQFYNTPLTYSTSTFGSGQAFTEPNLFQGLTTINTQMFNWTRSGLIPNVSVVNNYHPPIRDSVTGVLVNLPASIYKKTGNVASNSYALGSTLSTSGVGYVVSDFDVNQNVFGTDASYVLDALHNGSELKNAALNGTADVTNLVPLTAADHAASRLGGTVHRVTDNPVLAKEYFSKDTPLTQLQQSSEINLSSNQDKNLRKEPTGLRKLVTTGAPIAIPGLLNAVADTYIAGNIAWSPPAYSRTNVS